MEVMVAVQSGTLLHALRVQLKRRVSAFWSLKSWKDLLPLLYLCSRNVRSVVHVVIGTTLEIDVLYHVDFFCRKI